MPYIFQQQFILQENWTLLLSTYCALIYFITFNYICSYFCSKNRLKHLRKPFILIPQTFEWNCLHCSKPYCIPSSGITEQIFSCFLSALSYINQPKFFFLSPNVILPLVKLLPLEIKFSEFCGQPKSNKVRQSAQERKNWQIRDASCGRCNLSN